MSTSYNNIICLLTPSIYTEEGPEKCSDDLCDNFAIYCKQKIERKWKVTCSYKKIAGYADVDRSEDFEERLLRDSKYIVIIASSSSKDAVEGFFRKLTFFLSDLSDHRDRFLFIKLGKMEVSNVFMDNQTLNFSLNYQTENKDWKALFKFFEKDLVTHKVSTSKINICPDQIIKYVFDKAVKVYDKVNSTFPLKQSQNQILKGPSGLKNIKETYYLNSIIQALASSEKFIEQLCRLPQNNMLDKLIVCLKGINKDNSIDKNTDNLKEFIKTVSWNMSDQKEAFKLLSFVINSIQQDLNLNQTMPPKFQILHTYSENSRFNKVQDHLGLSVPLSGSFEEGHGESLLNLLTELFRPSLIDDGMYETTLFFFKEVPEVLIILVQANEWNVTSGKYVKPKYYINYRSHFEFTFKIHEKEDGSEYIDTKVLYDLMAVIHHNGDISSGHYTTCRKHEKIWYYIDDDHVERFDFKFDILPYIMVYEKRQET